MASEFKVKKPEGKTAKGVDEIQQSVIVTEHLTAHEFESELPESVIPFAKLARVSIQADHLEHIVGFTDRRVVTV